MADEDHAALFAAALVGWFSPQWGWFVLFVWCVVRYVAR